MPRHTMEQMQLTVDKPDFFEASFYCGIYTGAATIDGVEYEDIMVDCSDGLQLVYDCSSQNLDIKLIGYIEE